MTLSDYISLCALVVSLSVAAFTVYQYFIARRANLKFQMSIGRAYTTQEKIVNGQKAMIILEEKSPTTRLLVRNMSSRPSAIVEIRAKNPQGSILSDENGLRPGGQMPIRLEPWGIEIISTSWRPGEQTEGLYFEIKDIDEKCHIVNDYTNNRRLKVGDNALQPYTQKT